MKILYFAWFGEKIGKRQEEIEINSSIDNIDKLIELLCKKGKQYEEVFAEPSLVKVAVNKKIAERQTKLSPQDEVAFFPPITGG